MTDPHPAHDRFLVAALASGDLVGGERDRADALLAGCPDCAQLAADLRSLAAATARLPVPPRSRDFRLTAERAARLRPAGPRRLLAAFAGPRLAFTRPLATGLTTLGIAGLLLAALPGLAGSPAGGAGVAEQPAATMAAPVAPAESTPAATEMPKSAAGDRPTTDTGAGPETAAALPERLSEAAPSTATSPVLVLSVVFLAAGAVLFLLRSAGRRAVR